MTKAEQGECILPFMVEQLDHDDLRKVVGALLEHLNLCVDVSQPEKYNDLEFTVREI